MSVLHIRTTRSEQKGCAVFASTRTSGTAAKQMQGAVGGKA